MAATTLSPEERRAHTEFNDQAVSLGGRPWTVDEYQDRRFVMAHMSYGGALRDRIQTTKQWREIYLLGDGFGGVTPEFAEGQLEWDWSHVRDSSPEAITRMAQRIRQLVYFEEVTP